MASMQQVSAAAIRQQKKSMVDEIVKEAKSAIAKNKIKDANQEASATGAINNDQKLPMKLKRTQDFAGGHFSRAPLDTINPGQSGVFIHAGSPPSGDPKKPSISKAAILYAHEPHIPGSQLGWIVAWYKTESINQIYVEAGSLNQLMSGWDNLEQKLNASTTDRSDFWDEVDTGAAASATIKDNGNNDAAIGSVFFAI